MSITAAFFGTLIICGLGEFFDFFGGMANDDEETNNK